MNGEARGVLKLIEGGEGSDFFDALNSIDDDEFFGQVPLLVGIFGNEVEVGQAFLQSGLEFRGQGVGGEVRVAEQPDLELRHVLGVCWAVLRLPVLVE